MQNGVKLPPRQYCLNLPTPKQLAFLLCPRLEVFFGGAAGRRRLPADLPRERIELIPPASARHCPNCDLAKVRIGADLTEELAYVPASFVIREYLRPIEPCII